MWERRHLSRGRLDRRPEAGDLERLLELKLERPRREGHRQVTEEQEGQRRNVFLHFLDVEGGAHTPPEIGDTIEFELIELERGPRATQARIVKRAAPAH